MGEQIVSKVAIAQGRTLVCSKALQIISQYMVIFSGLLGMGDIFQGRI